MMVDPQLEIVVIVTRESGPGLMLVFSVENQGLEEGDGGLWGFGGLT